MATTTPSTRLLDNYVGGAWTRRRRRPTRSTSPTPPPGEVLARVPLSATADLDAAVSAARAALPAWRAVSVDRARAPAVRACARASTPAARSSPARVTTEMGKTLADARAEVGAHDRDGRGGLRASRRRCRAAILEDVARNVDAETIRQPVGVCAAIVPVQLPGDGAVLVPAVRDRLRQHVRAQALRAGAADAADRLRGARRARTCRPASSTSSTAGARSSRGSSTTRASTRSRSSARRRSRKIVYERAATSGKRVQALGGAKNHMVVMPDAVIDKTVDGIIGSAFGAAGQRCMAGLGRGDRRRGARAAARPRCVEATEALQRRRRARGRRSTSGPVDLLRRARPHRRGDRPTAVRTARRSCVDGRGAEDDPRRLVRRPDDPRRRRARTSSDRRGGDLRPGARRSSTSRRSTRRSRSSTRSRVRQRHLDLHRVRRGGPPLPPRRRGRAWSASTSASPRRSRSSRSRAGRTPSSATCTPTARTRSSSSRARRP